MAGETSSSRVGGCDPCSDPKEGQPAFLLQLERDSIVGCGRQIGGQDCAEQTVDCGRAGTNCPSLSVGSGEVMAAQI